MYSLVMHSERIYLYVHMVLLFYILAGLFHNCIPLQVLIKENLELKDNVSMLTASNSLLRATVAKLEDHVASLKTEVVTLRSNLSTLQALDLQLSSNSSTCGSSLEATASRLLGFEAGLIVLAIWLACEHVARPLWHKHRTDPFFIDRYSQ